MRGVWLACVVAGLLVAGAAAAGGGRIYPGGMCQPVSGLQNEDTIRDQDLWWNGIVDAQFMCPIVASKTKGTKGLREVELRVHPNGDTVACHLVSKSGTSSLSSEDVLATSSSDTTLVMTLLESLEGGSFLVRCTLPPGARIRSYLVVE